MSAPAVQTGTLVQNTFSGANPSATYDSGSSGGNRMLLLIIGGGGGLTSSAVTYGGVSMTVAATSTDTANYYSQIWYLTAAAGLPTGSNTIQVTNANSAFRSWNAVVLSDVDQTTPKDTTGTNASGTSSNPTNAITTTTNNCLVVAAVFNSAGIATHDQGTSLYETNNDALVSYESCSYIEKTTAGAQTLSFTRSCTWQELVAAFRYAAAPAGPANLKTYNTNAKANIKTINTNPIANVKTLDTNA